jgi:4,5-DOPA dioxygenase extradiol
MSTPQKTPVLFISHGAPTFALEPGTLGPQLQSLGRQLAGVKAILVVSPHWQSAGVKVMTTEQPQTVHDFGGFPAALYRLQYPASGAPQLAREAARLLEAAGYPVSLDAQRGLDHGAWVPLSHLRPGADIPVFQVSMPATLDTAGAAALGRALAPLREQGVLIVGSGSMTHNLYEFRQAGTQEEPYARAFANWIKTAVLADARGPLLQYRQEAPHAERAHPTEEHFLPLLVALGAASPDEQAQLIDGGITHGVLSMDSYLWGQPAPENALAAH